MSTRASFSGAVLGALSVLISLSSAGCSAELSDDDELAAVDDDDDAESSSSASAVSEGGRWRPSAQAMSAGAKARIPYDDAPAWNPSRCGGGFSAGGKKLKSFLQGKFAQISTIQGYACRQNTANQSRMSVHGTGRALDVFIPLSGGQADNSKGDAVANYLVEHAQELQIQFIVWDRSKWQANGTGDAPYGGPHPHHDHIHVEITEEGGRLETAWYKGIGAPGSAASALGNVRVRAKRPTYLKTTESDSSTLAASEKCAIPDAALVSLSEAVAEGDHVVGNLQSAHGCGGKFGGGDKVYLFRDHYDGWPTK